MKGHWEERSESRYGRWRGFVDGVVIRYLDCGVFEAGLARVQCRDCHEEYLVACSCKGRGLCPSCGAKRAAAFAVFLHDEVLEPVGHAMWTLTVPTMIRPYFLHTGLERLARYIMRPPLSLERMHWTEGARQVAYTLKPKEWQPGTQERLDPLDFLARLLAHVPEPHLHLAHYYGWYSNVSRGRRRKGITTILEHLRRKKNTATRAPPVPTSSLEAAS